MLFLYYEFLTFVGVYMASDIKKNPAAVFVPIKSKCCTKTFHEKLLKREGSSSFVFEISIIPISFVTISLSKSKLLLMEFMFK